jgi:hypothetical protein
MKFIAEYWTQIIFLLGTFSSISMFIIITIEGVKCSLRNDILQIYEMCKDDKKLSAYQYEAILKSAELYFKLRGNSFVKEIVNKIKNWEVID